MTDTLISQPSPAAPQPAWGVELFGEYKGSGFKEPRYLARRADGQVVQLSRLVYLVAAEADGQRSFEEIASRVSEEFGRTVSADNVRMLVEQILRPAGVLAGEDGTVPENLQRANPMLGLRLRVALVPARAVRAITAIFWPLFLPPVMIAVLGGLIAVDVWLFFHHGLIQSVQQILYQPSLIFVLFLLETIAGAFHECGHASACRYGGARPGVLGAGIYIVWFVFYSDVTDTYRLSKAARLRTDLGGIYFDAVFSLALAGAYFLTGFEPLLVLVLFNQLGALDEFTPFARFDGYYVVSDLIGVPDLFARIKPILLSLIPGRPADEGVTELKPWARAVVTVWVLTTIPVMLVFLVLLVIYGPTLILSAWSSVVMQSGVVWRSFEAGNLTDLVAALIQAGALVAPSVLTALFVTMMVWGLARRIVWRGSAAAWRGLGRRRGPEGGSLLKGGLWIAPVSVALGLALFIWLPTLSGYGPIQQFEHGVPEVQVGGIRAVPEIPAEGRPAQKAAEEYASKASPNDEKATTEGGAEAGDPSRADRGEPSHAEPSRADGPDTGQEDSAANAAVAPQEGTPEAPPTREPAPPSVEQEPPAASQEGILPTREPAPPSSPPPSVEQGLPAAPRDEVAPPNPRQPASPSTAPAIPAAPPTNPVLPANQKTPVLPNEANLPLQQPHN